MKTLKIRYYVPEGPQCFKNFFNSVWPQSGSYFTDFHVENLRNQLTNEPYDASIQRGYISDGSGGFSGYRYILKFPTDDDYVAFILRWS